MAEDHFLADWLNEQLKARNLSQGELARRGGVAKSVIHRLCASKVVKPDVSTYVAIAKGLGMPLITVLRETGLEAPDHEFPELEEIKHILQRLTPEGRSVAMTILQAMPSNSSIVKGAGRE